MKHHGAEMEERQTAKHIKSGACQINLARLFARTALSRG